MIRLIWGSLSPLDFWCNPFVWQRWKFQLRSIFTFCMDSRWRIVYFYVFCSTLILENYSSTCLSANFQSTERVCQIHRSNIFCYFHYNSKIFGGYFIHWIFTHNVGTFENFSCRKFHYFIKIFCIELNCLFLNTQHKNWHVNFSKCT